MINKTKVNTKMTENQCNSCIWRIEDHCGITGAKADVKDSCQKWNMSFTEIVDLLIK